MKTNAARELSALLENGVTGDAEPEWWEHRDRCIRLVCDIEMYMAAADPDGGVEMMREVRRLAYQDPADRDMSVGARSTLRAIALVLDKSPLAVSLDASQVQTLRDALQEALDILEGQVGVLDERVQYVAHLIRYCLKLLEGESCDLLTVKTLLFRIVGESASDTSENGGEAAAGRESVKRFCDAMERALGVFLTSTAAGVVGNLASGLISRQIGM